MLRILLSILELVGIHKGAKPLKVVSLPLEEVFTLELEPLPRLNMNGWSSNNQKAEAGAGQFRLVRVGVCSDLAEVSEKVTNLGYTPTGDQALWAFQKAYPKNNGQPLVACTQAFWKNEWDKPRFSVLVAHGSGWVRSFRDAENPQSNAGLWLVRVHK